MFRTARLGLFAFALHTLGISLTAMPASAQGAIRTHGTGAQTPVTLSKTPMQWEIRNTTAVMPEQEYAIFNLRRGELDLSSKLTFKENSTRDRTGWGQNGGDFIFKRDTASTTVRDHRGLRDSEFVAIFNTKTNRYLYSDGLWQGKPAYIWMVKKITKVGEGASAKTPFALFNSAQRKWLMVCQGEPLKPLNNEALCLYDDTFKPSH